MDFLTTREVGELCDHEPEWLIRRVVDALDPPVRRFGHKRMIPKNRLPEIQQALAGRRGSKMATQAKATHDDEFAVVGKCMRCDCNLTEDANRKIENINVVTCQNCGHDNSEV